MNKIYLGILDISLTTWLHRGNLYQGPIVKTIQDAQDPIIACFQIQEFSPFSYVKWFSAVGRAIELNALSARFKSLSLFNIFSQFDKNLCKNQPFFIQKNSNFSIQLRFAKLGYIWLKRGVQCGQLHQYKNDETI